MFELKKPDLPAPSTADRLRRRADVAAGAGEGQRPEGVGDAGASVVAQPVDEVDAQGAGGDGAAGEGVAGADREGHLDVVLFLEIEAAADFLSGQSGSVFLLALGFVVVEIVIHGSDRFVEVRIFECDVEIQVIVADMRLTGELAVSEPGTKIRQVNVAIVDGDVGMEVFEWKMVVGECV